MRELRFGFEGLGSCGCLDDGKVEFLLIIFQCFKHFIIQFEEYLKELKN